MKSPVAPVAASRESAALCSEVALPRRRYGGREPKRHLVIQPHLLRKFGHLRQRESLLRRGGIENLRHRIRRRRRKESLIGQENSLQRIRPALEGNLRPVLHVPKPLPRTRDSLRRCAQEHVTFDRLQQRFQFHRPPQPCVQVGQFPHRPVGDGFTPRVRGLRGVSPRFAPSLQRQRVMRGVVVFGSQGS